MRRQNAINAFIHHLLNRYGHAVPVEEVRRGLDAREAFGEENPFGFCERSLMLLAAIVTAIQIGAGRVRKVLATSNTQQHPTHLLPLDAAGFALQ